jgi:hypothetical protein
VGHFGSDYFISDAQHGRGLFAARHFRAGALVARFTGDVYCASSLPDGLACTHMLRLPGSDDVVDGRRLADALVREPAQGGGGRGGGRGGGAARPRCWRPRRKADLSAGYACMANASATHRAASTAVLFVIDDMATGVRPEGYDAAAAPAPLCAEAARVLPKAAYLVARRDLRPGEEVTWFYQVALE